MDNNLEFSFALSGLLNICVTLGCIGISWWALQQFRFDLFVKQPKSAQAKALQVIVSIVLGYLLARFVIDYLSWSTVLKGMFS